MVVAVDARRIKPVGARHRGDERWHEIVVVGLVAVLIAACSTATPNPSVAPSPSAEVSVPRGGTVRIVVPRKEQEASNFDPTDPLFLDGQQHFSRGTQELWRCCLARTLYSYNGLSAEEGGARLQPDLAVTLPDVSADGLTWTIRIKPGLRYGPPLEGVEITAADFIRSFHRLFSPPCAEGDESCAAVQGIWYMFDAVQGATDYNAGRAASISGLEAPDAHTLVVRLSQPQGDFGSRLAQTLVAPLPPDPVHPDAALGVAEGANGGFGPFVVSSGPYMLEGSAALDFSVPAAQRTGASGLTAEKVTLVRNPSWDPTTDALRPAYADRIEITVVDSTATAVAALDAGTADLLWNPRTPPSISDELYMAFQSNPARGRTHVNSAREVRYLVLNVAVPPFDDIHVRKALNWALDKQHLIDLLGGPSAAGVIGHVAADSNEDGLLLDYDPYATPGHRGDLAAARAEMKLSRYDTNGDGLCDAAACQHVSVVTREPFVATAQAAAESYRALGINMDVRVLDIGTFFDDSAKPSVKNAMYVGLTWTAGYISAWGVMMVFYSPFAIAPDDPQGGNTTMVGAPPEYLAKWGYEVTDVPDVDARVAACIPVVGAPQFQCWAALDQYLMENVVALVPYSQDRFVAVSSPRLVSYGYDELVGTTALDQLAVRP